MSAIALDRITKRFEGTAAVDDVSFTLDAGEFLTLLGPSGCGKSTTLRIVAGLVQADSGTVRIAGTDVTRTPVWRRNIGMVFQSLALFPHLTVAQNVAFGLRMRRLSRSEISTRILEALCLVQLDDYGQRYPRQLSGGQQQRVALARALVVRPHVLLLDEPFAALDRKLREAMQTELRDLTRRIGITAIFVTHDQEEALILSDRIAVMNQGRIEQLGSPGDVFERPTSWFVADFMGTANILPVKVTGREGSELLMQAGCAALRSRTGAGYLRGTDVYAAIRPERIRVMPEHTSPAPNRVAGTVISSHYHGSVSVHRIRADGEPECTLLVRETNGNEGEASLLESGKRVCATWPSEAVQVVPGELATNEGRP